ncbi:unnamed protein product, partial [Iphiclides podalirius]
MYPCSCACWFDDENAAAILYKPISHEHIMHRTVNDGYLTPETIKASSDAEDVVYASVIATIFRYGGRRYSLNIRCTAGANVTAPSWGRTVGIIDFTSALRSHWRVASTQPINHRPQRFYWPHILTVRVRPAAWNQTPLVAFSQR